MLGLLEGTVLAASIVALPPGAVVVEQQALPNAVHGPRLLVLWMLSPQTSECPSEADWAASCPGSTRGCYLRGPTRVSLVDPAARRLVNTVQILDPSGADSFDVPRKLFSASPYHVGRDHQARVLWLRDYTGESVKAEFALFDAESCSDLSTALLGYSAAQDRLIWYSVHSRMAGGDEDRDALWPKTLFATKPLRPGVWRYALAWPGDEALRTCEAHYLPGQEKFEAACRLQK